jgi:hypothetical protein
VGGDPSATIHCDALGYDLAVAIRVGHRDGITLPQIIRIADLTARFDARAGIQGERPLPILLPPSRALRPRLSRERTFTSASC